MLDRSFGDDLIPAYFFDRLTAITVEDLRAMGAKGVALDIDNTTAVDSLYTVFDGVREWIKTAQDAGFKVMVLTNTWEKRAAIISAKLGGVPFISKAHKPSKEGFQRAAEYLGVEISELAMVGDQLFTDIRGANRAGAISVRVRPMHKEYLLPVHYVPLRHREHVFLRSKGFGDKI